MAATDASALLHVPPVVVVANTVVPKRQTFGEPVKEAGAASTVTAIVAAQPVGKI